MSVPLTASHLLIDFLLTIFACIDSAANINTRALGYYEHVTTKKK